MCSGVGRKTQVTIDSKCPLLSPSHHDAGIVHHMFALRHVMLHHGENSIGFV